MPRDEGECLRIFEALYSEGVIFHVSGRDREWAINWVEANRDLVQGAAAQVRRDVDNLEGVANNDDEFRFIA